MMLVIVPQLGPPVLNAFDAAGVRNSKYRAKGLVFYPHERDEQFRYNLNHSYEDVTVVVYPILAADYEETVRYNSVVSFCSQQQVTALIVTPFTLEGEDENSQFIRTAVDKIELSGVRHFFIASAPLTDSCFGLARAAVGLLDSGMSGRMTARPLLGGEVDIAPAARKYDV